MRSHVQDLKRKAVFQKYDGHCGYCGTKLEEDNFEADHLVPRIAFRDNLKLGDTFENLMPSCNRCNHYKGQGDLKEYRMWLKNLHKELDSYLHKAALDYGVITEITPWDGVFYFENYVKQKA